MTSTAPNATDLGYLLHKHPARPQSFELSVGTAHVFYPEATDSRCTAALLLEVDPIALVRNRRFGGDAFGLAQYVNDRPYAASSMLAVALGQVFNTALGGACKARPELVGVALPLTIHIPAVPCRGGSELADDLFGPLGWSVDLREVPLDPEIPRWGNSRYLDLTLTGSMPLADALSQLYVLLPVLDGAKHYWVSGDEVDKLMLRGSGWLQSHPHRELIAQRYLAHQRSYVADAVERLAALDDAAPDTEINFDDHTDSGADSAIIGADHPAPASAVSLVQHRRAAVLAALGEVGAHRVIDLGCGEGALLKELLADPRFSEVVGVDVSARELDRAARRLNLDRMPDSQRARLTLLQSSATYRDTRLAGYDAVVLMEVIEHLDLERLPALERSVFAGARPAAVVVTTPNAEYNVRYGTLAAGSHRHPDHRFEWSRAEFESWAEQLAGRNGYRVTFRPIGEVDPEVGPPTQLAVFRHAGSVADDAAVVA